MNKIKLNTREGKLVIELSERDNPALYVMLNRGTMPEVLIWGARLFTRGQHPMSNQSDFNEVFGMHVL